MKIHPAAREFPYFDEKRLAELADDIAINGQREPIRTFKGEILDGRNRFNACQLIKVDPKFEKLPDDIDPWAYVWSLNGARRDLTQDQRYLIWKSCAEQSTTWQAEQQTIKDKANKQRSEAQIGIPKAEKERVPTKCGRTLNPTAKAKAHASKTNRGTVERMDKLAKYRPDLAKKVKSGEIKPTDALREMSRDNIIENLESVKTKEIKALAGEYDVIVIDPPWPMEKIERDVTPTQVKFDYPTMDETELSEMKMPATKNCHLWLWTTHKYLPMAFRLLEAWDFKYVCLFTWHKPGGFQPFDLPQYNSEFAIYARKGSPKFIDTKAFNVCFNAPRGRHSEKPSEFYDVVRRVTAGRRIDIFSRRKIDGFEGWGKEAK